MFRVFPICRGRVQNCQSLEVREVQSCRVSDSKGIRVWGVGFRKSLGFGVSRVYSRSPKVGNPIASIP